MNNNQINMGFALRNIPRYIETLGTLAMNTWNNLSPIGRYFTANAGVLAVHTATYLAEKKKIIESETKKYIDEFANGMLFHFSIKVHNTWLPQVAEKFNMSPIIINKILVPSVSIAGNLVKLPSFDAIIKLIDTGKLESNVAYLSLKHLPTQLFKYSIMSIPELIGTEPRVIIKAPLALIAGTVVYPIRAYIDSWCIQETLNKEKINSAFKNTINLYKSTIEKTPIDENLKQQKVAKFAKVMKSYKQGLLVLASQDDKFNEACQSIGSKIKNGALKNGCLKSDEASSNAIAKLGKLIAEKKPDYNFEAAIGGPQNLLIYFSGADFFTFVPLRLMFSGSLRVLEIETRNPYYDTQSIFKEFTNIIKGPLDFTYDCFSTKHVEPNLSATCPANSRPQPAFSHQCLIEENMSYTYNIEELSY